MQREQDPGKGDAKGKHKSGKTGQISRSWKIKALIKRQSIC